MHANHNGKEVLFLDKHTVKQRTVKRKKLLINLLIKCIPILLRVLLQIISK